MEELFERLFLYGVFWKQFVVLHYKVEEILDRLEHLFVSQLFDIYKLDYEKDDLWDIILINLAILHYNLYGLIYALHKTYIKTHLYL